MFSHLARYWRNYFWQSLWATLAVFVVLLALSLRQAVAVASIGATAFILFMKPSNPFAAPRKVIGGHLVGLILGTLCARIPHPSLVSDALIGALAVGSALFVMAVTDTEHPPAAGTALTAVTSEFSWITLVTVLASVGLLVILQRLTRRYLRDL
jgi:CBS-domain-containing membrane protein